MGKIQKIIKLDETQKDLILTNLDEDGRITCLKAFKVARLIALKPIEMSDACASINVKISNCELGVFGKIKFKQYEEDILKSLQKNFTQKKKVECKVLWNEARTSTLRKVGSAVKASDIDVTSCQLGCFREKLGHARKS